MTYVERSVRRLKNQIQRALSYTEMGNKERALEAMREVVTELRELTRAVESTQHEDKDRAS